MADGLVAAILAGRYPPASFIPKELEICRHYGLSRSRVRRHLARLVQCGIIERISGHGSRVCPFSRWHILDPTVTDWIARFAGPHLEILREVLSFRLSAEPGVAALAAERATPSDLAAIEAAFEGMRCQAGAHAEYNEYDAAFHVAIYCATHNLVWSRLSHVLRPSIHLLVTRSNVDTPDPDENLARHRKLMEAIRAGRPREAFDAARAVLAGTADALGLALPDEALFNQAPESRGSL